MQYLVYLVYPLLAVALFWKSKVFGIRKWNDEFLSLDQTKAIQGFCAIGIMLHHCGQKTCMPGMREEVVRHGLDPFVPIGYFFVAIFLFCSGYGLYKSFKSKPGYLKDFSNRKFLPILFVLLISSILFAIARVRCEEALWFTQPFRLGGPNTFNPYAWYIYAFFIFNIAFYFSFRYIKKEKIALIVTSAVVVLYMIHCDFWMYGNWWINTSLLFIIGILVARHEEKLVKHVKKFYAIYLPLALILTAGFFVLGEYTSEVTAGFVSADSYDALRLIRLFGQIFAAIFFTIAVFLIGMKVKIGNKLLKFMSTITLEFYLVHGLFVQGFSYAFLDENFDPFYYIENVFLYVIVVFILGVLLSVLIKKVTEPSISWLDNKGYLDMFWVGIQRLLIVLIPLIILLTVYRSVSSHSQSKKMQADVAKYQEENITFVEVDGKQMATYVTGEGDHTIIVMQRMGDYCPTITLRGLADWLGKHYKVVVIDYFGTGFSDDTDTPRDIDEFANEIHTVVGQLGIEGQYILMPNEISGIYAMRYIEQYPDEVEALIGIDAVVPGMFTEEMDIYNSRIEDVVRNLEKRGSFDRAWKQLLCATGFVRVETPSFSELIKAERTEKDIDILDEVIISNKDSINLADEIRRQPENYEKVYGMKLPSDLPTVFILNSITDNMRYHYGMDYRKMYGNVITNEEIQRISTVEANPYFIYYDPKTVAKRTTYFIDEVLDGKE